MVSVSKAAAATLLLMCRVAAAVNNNGPSGVINPDGTVSEMEDEEITLSPEDLAVLQSIKDPIQGAIVEYNLLEEAKIRADLTKYTHWSQLEYEDMHAHFTCHRVITGTRPVYDHSKWTDLREFYNEFVELDLKENPLEEGEKPRTYKYSDESFDAPVEAVSVSYTSEEGEEEARGVKAARDITKGELVFQATNNTVVFTDGNTWKAFLFDLYERNGDEPYDAETACDFMVSSWIQRLEEGGPLVIVADMDNGSLLNEGQDDNDDYDPPNVRCGKEGDKICMNSYYATKDIKKGEELLCDDTDFVMPMTENLQHVH